MAMRRPSWPRSCLNRATAIPRASRPSSKSQIRSSPAPLDRRCLATHSAHHVEKPQFAEFLPPRQRTEVDALVRAIQLQDHSRVRRTFTKLSDILAEPNTEAHEQAVQQLQELSPSTFSEILRSLDPLIPSHDVAHGLNVTLGDSQYTDARKLVNEFGVRMHHRNVLQGMYMLLQVRSLSDKELLPADYEVLLRCAGAGVDYQAAKDFWTAMASSGQQKQRTSKTWAEFIKARFLLEPLYYQYDRSRVAVLARDQYSNRAPMPMAKLKRLDNLRLSINALKPEPWNRRYDEPEEDLRRLFRRRTDFRAYKSHWIRALYYGHEMDEELLAASMIAFSRSSSLERIKTLILGNYYGIEIRESESKNPEETTITGGLDIPHASPLRPTARLLNAIVEAFGSMSHISLCTKLLHFVSSRYNIPIPAETWSNLLSWTYLCQSKPYQRMRKIQGPYASTTVRAADVRHVWDTMTSAPYNIQPTFADYNIYIKTLIAQRSLTRALAAITEHIIPHYRAAAAAHEAALRDEILQTSAIGHTPARAATRRLRAGVLKDHTHARTTYLFTQLFKSASAQRTQREGPVSRVFIPDLVRDYGEFLPPSIKYRTAQGVAELDRADADADARFDGWRQRWRTTLPQKEGGYKARQFEDSGKAEFPYPMVKQMRVAEWRRVPKKRSFMLGTLGEAEWRDKVESELAL
ncbi:hypothetical protein K4F52_008377 [Lecanicillium sp. MT-2017a]|nr:hypothetical protein K4F52_008377 [Lecanicillium sp. MT-2017a]